MAKAPKPGSKYKLAGEDVGIGVGAIPTGTVVTVREIVPAEEPGAHDNTEEAVVLEWDDAIVIRTENGEPEIGYTTRAWACGIDQFGEVFEAVN